MKDNVTKTAEETAGQTVKLRLPKLREQQEDVFVSVNNRTWLIKRGEEVEVPACVAEVLQHAEEMADQAMQYERTVQMTR